MSTLREQYIDAMAEYDRARIAGDYRAMKKAERKKRRLIAKMEWEK